MRIGRILSFTVVGLASLIVIGTASIALIFFINSRRDRQQNFAPPEGKEAISPGGSTVLLSQASGKSSLLYRKDSSSGKTVRLTGATTGIESEASFSHDGKLIVYSFANSPDSQSAVWIVGSDGHNPHAVTSKDEDALHPVFSPDDSTILYAVSSFTGNNSPIVRPARHDWDVFSIPVQPNATGNSVTPTRITRGSFYDLRSLDVAGDKTSSGTKVLISTTGYPIGALLEEFNLDFPERQKIFQPHVPGEAPAFGEARFIDDGMGILFLAATDTSGGTFDYNVYSMSDVTGSELKQLTHLKGMTKELKILPDGKATFVNGEVAQVLDIDSKNQGTPLQ